MSPLPSLRDIYEKASWQHDSHSVLMLNIKTNKKNWRMNKENEKEKDKEKEKKRQGKKNK